MYFPFRVYSDNPEIKIHNTVFYSQKTPICKCFSAVMDSKLNNIIKIVTIIKSNPPPDLLFSSFLQRYVSRTPLFVVSDLNA